MSATTELVRHIVEEVIQDEQGVNDGLAQSISSKVAGDPELDRVEISEDSLKPVAHTVADATYRVDLAGFGVSNPDRARREIVEGVTQHFAAQTESSENGSTSNNDQTQTTGTGKQTRSADSDNDIIVAGAKEDESNDAPSKRTSISSDSNDQSPEDDMVAATGTGSIEGSDSDEAVDNSDSDDIIVAEPDDVDTMGTAYDNKDNDVDDDSASDREMHTTW
ncbi:MULTISPECIES: hypothetical protein [Haloarcula]|uniref:Uncharacterized protein n=2 Tax=Haloarcula marismortui TaxID=2238 RepID=M0JDS8_9EURY|nr:MULTISPECIES: hypothetical protein [Haloarcula]EMA07302.1 hypothetical protein C436_21305 [Haloarcula sinaiiensis ATCC 33800]EMA09290.1 hypothetical protein C435_22139 [Haloarcula californiae ATCC 33799]NHN65680.1 hypothetical protein [Haloarcula sp. JP-Z28]QUJ74853.1 hypothetical protein KDQ40_21420 [Haloarcula sinaiiensis ATCC 33800]